MHQLLQSIKVALDLPQQGILLLVDLLLQFKLPFKSVFLFVGSATASKPRQSGRLLLCIFINFLELLCLLPVMVDLRLQLRAFQRCGSMQFLSLETNLVLSMFDHSYGWFESLSWLTYLSRLLVPRERDVQEEASERLWSEYVWSWFIIKGYELVSC